jgi:hypothetical protein
MSIINVLMIPLDFELLGVSEVLTPFIYRLMEYRMSEMLQFYMYDV